MPDKKDNLYLYEALELRSEYKARLNTLRKLLPENYQGSRGVFGSSGKSKEKPVEELSIDDIRDKIESYEKKQRKLNNAIQLANFDNHLKINHNGDKEKMTIAEALDYRKRTNDKIGELSNKLSDSAYKEIIYKEDRDIEQKPDLSYKKIQSKLEDKRQLFRELNRKLKKATFDVVVNFKDEK